MNSNSALTSELKKLLRQSSHYLFGIGGSMALGFISFPIFTRMFSIADFGMIDYVQKILLLLTALGKAGMQNSVFRFFDHKDFANDPAAAQRYYSTTFFGVTAIAALVTIPLAVSGLLPKWISGDPLLSILCFASSLVFLRAMQSILWSFLRIEERTKASNVVTILLKASTILAVILLLPTLGASVRTYFIAVMAVECTVVLILVGMLVQRGLLKPTSFDPILFRAAVAFGLPLVLQETSGIFLDAGDRFMVDRYMGADALGFYSVAYGLAGQINSVLMTPLGLAIIPIYMRIWNSEGVAKTSEFLSVGLDLFIMAAVGTLATVMVVSYDAVLLMASPKYAGADRLIPVIVAGLLIYAAQIFLNAGLMIHKKTYAMAGALAASSVLNLGLNALLLPRIGLQAAALATLISYAFCTFLLARMAFKVLPMTIAIKPICTYLLAGTAVWGSISYVEFGNAFLNFLGKSTLSLTLYVVLLYLLDGRVRAFASSAWSHLRGRVAVLGPVVS